MKRRTERVNDLLREELDTLLRREAKDPRLGTIWSITDVEVTRDLRHAKVFVSVLGTEEEGESTLEGMNAGAAFIPSRVLSPSSSVPSTLTNTFACLRSRVTSTSVMLQIVPSRGSFASRRSSVSSSSRRRSLTRSVRRFMGAHSIRFVRRATCEVRGAG